MEQDVVRKPSASDQENSYEYSIEVVENAARTLLMLAARPSIRATDVAAELGVGRSTAHRMVMTLVQTGLLRRNEEDKTYTAGFALVELGMAVIGATDLRAEIQPILTRLAAATGETTHFLVRETRHVAFITVAESPRVIRAGSRVGSTLPAHVTSAGRAMLSLLPQDELLSLYPPDVALKGGTGDAIHTRDELVADLLTVATTGIAVNYSASEPGLTAVSRAVRDRRGSAVGAISVSGPANRVDAHVAQIAEELTREVTSLERWLGRASR